MACLLQSASEVETLKAQMMSLFNELQQAQSKLDEAENMKRNLQDRFTILNLQIVYIELLSQQSEALSLITAVADMASNGPPSMLDCFVNMLIGCSLHQIVTDVKL